MDVAENLGMYLYVRNAQPRGKTLNWF